MLFDLLDFFKLYFRHKIVLGVVSMVGWHNDQRTELGLVISGVRGVLNIHTLEPPLALRGLLKKKLGYYEPLLSKKEPSLKSNKIGMQEVPVVRLEIVNIYP